MSLKRSSADYRSLIGILVLVTVLFSCSEDEPTFAELIVGRWQLEEISNATNLEPCYYSGWVEFKSDRSYQDYNDCTIGTTDGGWKIEGSRITIISAVSPFPLESEIVKLTKSEFVIEWDGVKRQYGKVLGF